MAIQQTRQARLSQKLILTPSLQQAIELLPMSTLGLVDMLNQDEGLILARRTIAKSSGVPHQANARCRTSSVVT